MAGLLVVLEGQDYSGKTTARSAVAEKLRAAGYDVLETREPGGTPVAEDLREFIFSRSDEMSRLSELYLFQAARADHVEKVIRPALDAGKIVLCDRFYLSTWAWQVHPYVTEQDTTLLQAFGESLQVVLGNLGNIFQIFLDVPKSVREERRAIDGVRNPFDNKPAHIAAKIEEAYEILRTSDDVNFVNGNEAPGIVADVMFGLIQGAITDNDKRIAAEGAVEQIATEETPQAAVQEVADADLPPLDQFIEESIVQTFAKLGLVGILHPKRLNKWRTIAQRKGREIYKVASADNLSGQAAYQQVDRAIQIVGQIAHSHATGEQMLEAKAPSKVEKTTGAEEPPQTKAE